MFKLDETVLINAIRIKIPNLRLIYLFGSYANGEQHPESDLDIAILPAKTLDNLTRWEIAQALASEFDIDVDLIDLSCASTVLCQQVITQGICLWGSTRDDDIFTTKTMSMYQHLQSERAAILSDFEVRNNDK
ncbi:nucleotidyltransferase domain-containing protein [Shewanella sp.]|uniref:type VII toxin-antitoxin system MntA family adenylyltransferase antitoxin n=1 Tax=Shewanella sp. TaxID=50422 RepID=UPI001EB93C2F|nr:nucleotidyltransferase domain-containing protein [Shewanella sp.]NRB25018.1 nucleotidyltransferase domain-containing protein [Shewanella sp.]